jgi:hypothetical protein
MSTCWDLECTTHDDSAGWNINHGADQLAMLWRHRSKVQNMLAALGDIFDIDGLELNSPWTQVSTTQARWLVEHKDCTVVLLNEYGDKKSPDDMAPLPPQHCRTCTCAPR